MHGVTDPAGECQHLFNLALPNSSIFRPTDSQSSYVPNSYGKIIRLHIHYLLDITKYGMISWFCN